MDGDKRGTWAAEWGSFGNGELEDEKFKTSHSLMLFTHRSCEKSLLLLNKLNCETHSCWLFPWLFPWFAPSQAPSPLMSWTLKRYQGVE